MKILILCTGNSCRSQMAEGFLKSFDNRLEVYSAGTHPEAEVNTKTIIVMEEEGIDLSMNSPKSVDEFLNKNFDYVVTVCGSAKTSCPSFTGNVKHNMHIGFEDPADAEGTEEEIFKVYREIRDEIKDSFSKFYKKLPG
ncbi:MAG: arsenate reductase ArsC [Bacteroidales bacterium]|nr:arsenate reductase ArsC [Bacteroidales bacterium]